MEHTLPLVSIVIATFNENPKMIQTAINSVLNQTYQNIEVLVFDDSTSIETKGAIDILAADSRLKVFRSPKRVGFVKSLNNGLEIASGKYIARMDGDDFSLSNRIEKEVMFLETHPTAFVVGGQIDIIDETGKVISHRSYPTSGIKLWLFSCYRNPLAHPTIMMRREIVDKGYRYNENLKMSEDLDFWLRLLNDSYRIANIGDTVLQYRVQSDFTEKRLSTVQREYMSNVRKANCSIKRPFHSTLSCISGWAFTHVSLNHLKELYRKENRRT